MTLMRRTAALALAVLAGLSLGACGSDSDSPSTTTAAADAASSESVSVSVDDNLFDPEQATVSAGDSVRWEWVGAAPHNVTGEGFQSETQTEGEFEHTFDEAGTYEYVCTLHTEMKGTIEVTS